MQQRWTLKFYAMCLGAASMGVQILLLRQFMTVFYGNEIIIGAVLSLWLLWIGVGSYVGQRCWATKSPAQFLFPAGLFLSILSAIGVYVATKFVRLFYHIPYGEFLAYSDVVLFACWTLFLPAGLFGFLFALLARLCRDTGAHSEAAGFVYAYEALGTVIVGLLFTVMLMFFSNLVCLFTLGLLLFGLAFFLTRNKSLLAPIFLFVVVLIPPVPHKLEDYLLHKYWATVDESFRLKDWRFTRFGQASIIEWGGELFLYQNGIKVSALSNTIDNQSQAATLLVQHPNPEKILCIEGNSGGLALECAKFHLDIDVMELDGDMFRFARSHLDSVAAHAWEKSIRLFITDARRALKQKLSTWDMIILNVGAPTTAASNRYYTRRFFQLAKASLAENGVLAICFFPAGENFLGDELLELNKTLWNTLNSEFSHILALPGETATYFASNAPQSLVTSLPDIEHRYAARNPTLAHFAPSMYSYIYQNDRISEFAALLSTSPQQRLNSDFNPASYIYDFLIWHKIMRGADQTVSRVFAIPFSTVVIFLSVILIVLVFLLYFTPARWAAVQRVRLSAAIIGFCGMTFSVILLLAFQTLFGYIYAWIGVAMAVYMAGMGGASLLVTEKVMCTQSDKSLPWLLFLAGIVLLLLMPIFTLLDRLDMPPLYIGLFFMSGALIGTTFPLLCRSLTSAASRMELGTIYASDVLGGAIGAFVISSFLVPLYGFFKTVLLTTILCFTGCVLFIIRGKRIQ
ncbi:hypothetical protein EH223_10315 [candidate division KSB1 bacterium]|nr:hypothetical protein [candidate division KSB1 bacterium]RQW03274.1 MAG: hypothetical protein EH223_10315 [candidate division KSB1 bacterium]